MEDIHFFNRYSNSVEKEKVFGNDFLKWLYQSKSGNLFRPIFASKYFSMLYGNYKGNLGQIQIDKFVEEYDIDPEDFVSEKGKSDLLSYNSFNDFFIRRFKEGKREFNNKPHILPAFCEGRYLGFDSLSDISSFPVKGEHLNIQSLIQRDYPKFKKGPVLICRLAPVDYHHFHYPDDGELMEEYTIDGRLDSVTPFSLQANGDVFIKNERQVSILETRNFGSVVYVEVGALTVGKIIQTHNEREFRRGETKGHFKFGASTVILIGEENAFKVSDDILEQTKQDRETYIKLGDEIGSKLKCL